MNLGSLIRWASSDPKKSPVVKNRILKNIANIKRNINLIDLNNSPLSETMVMKEYEAAILLVKKDKYEFHKKMENLEIRDMGKWYSKL